MKVRTDVVLGHADLGIRDMAGAVAFVLCLDFLYKKGILIFCFPSKGDCCFRIFHFFDLIDIAVA